MTAVGFTRQQRRWAERHPRGLVEVRGMRYVADPDKTDRHILRKWVKEGVEYAFHATKGLRRRRINS